MPSAPRHHVITAQQAELKRLRTRVQVLGAGYAVLATLAVLIGVRLAPAWADPISAACTAGSLIVAVAAFYRWR
ncbi:MULTISPECIES: hypothetical protein [unclassified Streptomyces]|uniref:hypothetical protein n=1 Tax=unclassified Streptomyces TaxID=2593676 RepID=UPI00332B0647